MCLRSGPFPSLREKWKESLEEQGVGRTEWRRIKGVGKACEKVQGNEGTSPAGLIVCTTTGAHGRAGVFIFWGSLQS